MNYINFNIFHSERVLLIMNKSTKQGIIGAAIIATVGLSSTVHADETSVSQPQAKTPMTVSNEDKISEITKETVDMAKANADETAKTVTEQEQVVSDINQKVKEAEATEKIAIETYAKTKEIAEKTTPKNISKAEDVIKVKEEGVKIAEEELKKAEGDEKLAEKIESESRENYEVATKKVEAEKAKVELAKEKVKKAERSLEETTLIKAQEMVNIAGNKLKEAETTYKAAQAELTRATEFDAERQVKIDERKSTLDKLKTEKDISALEQSLEDAKAKVDSKAKVLEEMKAKLDAAQSEIENAKKALTDAQAAYDLVLKKFEQDRKLRAIVVPKEYATHDITDYEWFTAKSKEFMNLQPEEVDYDTDAIGSNADKVDLANMTAAQRREIAEFTVQMMNDIQRQYWAHRDPSKTLSTIRLTDEGQALAQKVADEYSAYYVTNGGTPDKFGFTKNWSHQYDILNKYGVSESLGGLLTDWHNEYRDGYTMLTLKYDIATNVRKMLFDDGRMANGHAKHLIDPNVNGTGTGVGINTGAINIVKIPKRTLDVASLPSTYKNTDQDAETTLKQNTGLSAAEKALEKAKTKKKQIVSAVKDGEAALAAAQKAQENTQTALNAANNAIAKAQKTYNDALAVKEQSPSAQAKVDETAEALEKAKAELVTTQSNLNNLQQIREQREVELKNAKSRLIAQEGALKTALKEATNAENDLTEKGLAIIETKQRVERTKEVVKEAEQAVKEAKAYLELLKNAPMELEEAEKILTKAKVKTTEAKEKLEAEIAKLEILKSKNKVAQEDYKRVLESYKKFVRSKELEHSIRWEQEHIHHEEGNHRNEVIRHETFSSKVEVPIVTKRATMPIATHVKQTDTKKLPSTGDSVSTLGFMGIVMAVLGFVGLKRKRESKHLN